MTVAATAAAQNCQYDPRCVNNPYGTGSPYKPDGLMNPYGSPYSNKLHTNPYATDAPKLVDDQSNYRDPYGHYGNPYSLDSIKNPYGAGNPDSPNPIYVVPSR
jgi:hypothetical protein